MKKLLALSLLLSMPAAGAYGGYILFQTLPSMVGSSITPLYPLLISGTYAQFATVANGGKVVNTVPCGVSSIVCPADLVFMRDSSCSTPYTGWEIIAYSPTSGKLSAIVQIPALSNVTPVKVYGCVGNSAVSTFQGGSRGSAYDNNYLLALHMEETSGTILHDSTANGNNAVKKGSLNPAPSLSGQVGAAQSFLGTANSVNNDYALFNSLTAASSTWTIEYWLNAASFINVDSVFIESSSGAPSIFFGFYWYPPPSNIRYFNSYSSASPGPPAEIGTGVYHNITYVRNGDSMNVYLDGVAGTPAAGFGSGTDGFKGLGWDGTPGGTNTFNGLVDEVSVSNTARSADYITARFNNLKSPSTFYTVGSYSVSIPTPRSTTRDNSQIRLLF